MPRKYVRRTIKTNKSNWSHENVGFLIDYNTQQNVNGYNQVGTVIVPSNLSQGTRTVGNFTITVPSPWGTTNQNEVIWALVYVPQGTTANTLFSLTGDPNGSLYEPNQYVLASGISDSGAGPIRIRTRMSRKLHSGDFISLIIGSLEAFTTNNRARGLISYSIKYN